MQTSGWALWNWVPRYLNVQSCMSQQKSSYAQPRSLLLIFLDVSGEMIAFYKQIRTLRSICGVESLEACEVIPRLFGQSSTRFCLDI